jgi:hypothetical protein
MLRALPMIGGALASAWPPLPPSSSCKNMRNGTSFPRVLRLSRTHPRRHDMSEHEEEVTTLRYRK